MKKRNIVLFLLFFVFIFYLAGCDDTTTNKKSTTRSKDTDKTVVTNNKTTNKQNDKTSGNNKTENKTHKTTSNTNTSTHTVTTHSTTTKEKTKTYLLSVISNDSTAGVTSSFYRKKALEGDTFDLTAKANKGYYFAGWKDLSNNSIISTEANYTYEMPNKDVMLEATYSYFTFSSVNSEDSGNITEIEAQKVSPGDSVTISCEPHSGVKFAGWYDYNTDELVSSSSTYTFAMPKKNTKYVAKYSYAKLHLQLNIYDNDLHYEQPININYSIYEEAIYKCQIGDVVPVQIRRTDNNSPYLEGFYDENGNLITTDYRFEIEITDNDVYVLAKGRKEFSISNYRVYYTDLFTTISYKHDGDSEFVEYPSNGRANLIAGDTYIFKAPEVEGYEFVGWFDYNGMKNLSDGNYECTYTIVRYEDSIFPQYQRTLTISGVNGEEYKDLHCTILCRNGYYGEVYNKELSEDGTIKLNMSETYVLTVSDVQEGYTFNGWYSNDGSTSVSTTTTAQIKDDGTILGYKISIVEE